MLRLAWRQLLRTKGSSLLVVALIALPVAGAAGALTFLESRTPSPEQAVTLELGRTQSWIRVAGGADPSRRQAIDMPQMTSQERTEQGVPVHPDLPPPTDLRDAALPADTETISITESSARITTRTGVAELPVVYGDAWDPRLDGRYDVISGRAAENATEGMASPALLERLGADVGDQVRLPDEQRSFRIVGVMQALDGTVAETLFLPSAAMDEKTGEAWYDHIWFLPDWQPDIDELQRLNHAGYVSYARDLVLDPPPGAEMATSMASAQNTWTSLILVTLGMVFGGLLVGLLAAAAMAVSARRQQRSLALVTTVGARRGDVFRLVLAQGAVLGLAGGVAGAALAVGGVWICLLLFDPGVKNTFWSSWGLKVPWTVAGVVGFAVLVGLAASALPARSATRGDALAALRGARGPVVMSRRQPVWGIVILIVGAATVAVGGTIFGILGAQGIWNEGMQLLALWASIIGVLILLLGVTVTGQGILAALSRLLARIGPAARLASRDAFANSPRTVPAFVSIAASTAVAAFVLCSLALMNAQAVRNYAWQAPAGSVIVTNWGEPAAATPPAFLAEAGPERIIALSASPEISIDADGNPIGPESGIVYLSHRGGETGSWVAAPGQPITVVAPDDVERVTGIRLTDRQREDFEEGGAIAVLSEREPPERSVGYVSGDHTARLDFWDVQSITSAKPSEPMRSVEFPVDVHIGAPSAYPVLLSPAAAERLGVQTVVRSWVGLFAEPPSTAVMDRLRADAETASAQGQIYDVRAENGPDSPLPWLVLVLGVLSVIVISAAAISLGLARIERREDDATLAAVGATARLRRAVSAWQAIIIAGVGCVVGVLLGIVGTWALTQAVRGTLLSDLPATWLLAIALGLPLLIALVSLLIRPPNATLTRRTAIA